MKFLKAIEIFIFILLLAFSVVLIVVCSSYSGENVPYQFGRFLGTLMIVATVLTGLSLIKRLGFLYNKTLILFITAIFQLSLLGNAINEKNLTLAAVESLINTHEKISLNSSSEDQLPSKNTNNNHSTNLSSGKLLRSEHEILNALDGVLQERYYNYQYKMECYDKGLKSFEDKYAKYFDFYNLSHREGIDRLKIINQEYRQLLTDYQVFLSAINSETHSKIENLNIVSSSPFWDCYRQNRSKAQETWLKYFDIEFKMVDQFQEIIGFMEDHLEGIKYENDDLIFTTNDDRDNFYLYLYTLEELALEEEGIVRAIQEQKDGFANNLEKLKQKLS